MGPTIEAQAETVCLPCKRRKKRCDKSLPSCGRCTRFNTDCYYVAIVGTHAIHPALPNATHESSSQPTGTPSIEPLGNSAFLSNLEAPSFEEILAIQIRVLVARISPSAVGDYSNYFANFHSYLPIINEERFYWRLQNSKSDQRFSQLMLGMSLVAQLSSTTEHALSRAKEIYPTLKGAFSYHQAVGAPAVDLVQTGVMVASFEHCQGFHQEAWMTIGACVRMGHILRQQELNTSDSISNKKDSDSQATLWCCIAILERIISADYTGNQVPHASEPPKADDILPATLPGDKSGLTVSHNLYLAEDLQTDGNFEIKSCEFTTLSPFTTTVQATYFSSLVTEHILHGSKDPVSRGFATVKLDMMLQAFGGTLIPPPGKAVGHYCGAFGISTCAIYYLHSNEITLGLEAGNEIQVGKSIAALQSITRMVIYGIKHAYTGVPMDLDCIAFWAHKTVYHAALCHIRYGARNHEWEVDLEECKAYLRYFAPRFKLHSNYLYDIEVEQQKCA